MLSDKIAELRHRTIQLHREIVLMSKYSSTEVHKEDLQLGIPPSFMNFQARQREEVLEWEFLTGKYLYSAADGQPPQEGRTLLRGKPWTTSFCSSSADSTAPLRDPDTHRSPDRRFRARGTRLSTADSSHTLLAAACPPAPPVSTADSPSTHLTAAWEPPGTPEHGHRAGTQPGGEKRPLNDSVQCLWASWLDLAACDSRSAPQPESTALLHQLNPLILELSLTCILWREMVINEVDDMGQVHNLQELRRSASLATKVFIQRDYSDGTICQFQTKFPPELDSRIERQLFEETVKTLNGFYAEAEKIGGSSYLEGCLACATAYFIFLCMETHYEKVLKKISRYIQEQNEKIFAPRGLLLTDPVERGMRVIEISIYEDRCSSGSSSSGSSSGSGSSSAGGGGAGAR
ncbi:Golgin subfamily A member 7B [Fukomys damarensis]|uniref:Hexosyltransferase n=1 Tax=Fukomys damarensis TaxID=885580 RepID=A0A091D7W8_FUKDA|nr:Golgin subfamily A member 7B [Fukomys damarensis]